MISSSSQTMALCKLSHTHSMNHQYSAFSQFHSQQHFLNKISQLFYSSSYTPQSIISKKSQAILYSNSVISCTLSLGTS